MYSKTFKSSTQANDNRTLSVEKLYGEPRLTISDEKRMGFLLDPSDAPALALAILEAAGADSDVIWSGAKDYGNADHLGWIAGHLDVYIKTQERATAEAKEQAELEAEALELANSAVLVVGNPPYPSIGHMSDRSLRKWLAVARKAREMAKEDTK